jgi:cyanophycin synthetase
MSRPLLLSIERAALRIRKLIVDRAGWSGQVYFENRVAEYRSMWQRIAAAEGLTFTELAADLWQLDHGSFRTRILNHQLEFDNPVVLGLAGRKDVVHRLLAADGLQIPAHAVFTLDTLETAAAFAARYPAGCVIKPAGGYGGKGVTTHIQGAAEIRRAALLASLYDADLLVEAQIPGECYRLLVIEGRLVDAACRRGPRLLGDGSKSVGELIADENTRRTEAGLAPLTIDRDCLFTLRHQGLTPQSRPEPGRVVLVKTVNDSHRNYREVRTVYTERATDRVCESIRRDAERAAAIVGSEFLGVDVITPDPSRPLAETGGVINEVNTTPALHHHYDAERDAFPAAAVLALRALVKKKGALTTV